MYAYYRDSTLKLNIGCTVALVSDQKVPCRGCLLLLSIWYMISVWFCGGRASCHHNWFCNHYWPVLSPVPKHSTDRLCWDVRENASLCSREKRGGDSQIFFWVLILLSKQDAEKRPLDIWILYVYSTVYYNFLSRSFFIIHILLQLGFTEKLLFCLLRMRTNIVQIYEV
jgi:hypothetical protein